MTNQMYCCILGAVIVGSVEGSRLWGKELKKLMLTGVQWSPNSKFLLFTIKTGEVHLYDSDGNFIVCTSSIVLMCGMIIVCLISVQTRYRMLAFGSE